ncbi:histone H3-like centromeric protein CSE4 [Dissostichus eleginoides]|uniref:Histone H3-like centromeric protein CSE4 n=1 Tax=Dissostichus eleginoides TaxID=100907 RepID=A0AAD9FCF2_DISEL|nr:histone H3-like centromeric protein CSE4 [Dissostichus eleginoides]
MDFSPPCWKSDNLSQCPGPDIMRSIRTAQRDRGLIFRQRPIPNLLPNEPEQYHQSFKEQQPRSRHGGR